MCYNTYIPTTNTRNGCRAIEMELSSLHLLLLCNSTLMPLLIVNLPLPDDKGAAFYFSLPAIKIAANTSAFDL